MLQSNVILSKSNLASVGTWHPHVYSNPPKKPTAYFVADILGLDSSHRPKQLSSGILTSGGLNRVPKTETTAEHRGVNRTNDSSTNSVNSTNLIKSQPDRGKNNSETKVNHSSKGIKKAKGKSGRDKKKKKARTTFTGRQIFELENMFEEKKYLNAQERSEMATLLNVTETQVKIWFQNRRTKWKKMEKAQQEIENNEHGIDKERGESNSDEDDEGSSCDDARGLEESEDNLYDEELMNHDKNTDNSSNDNANDTESNSDTNAT